MICNHPNEQLKKIKGTFGTFEYYYCPDCENLESKSGREMEKAKRDLARAVAVSAMPLLEALARLGRVFSKINNKRAGKS